MNYTSINIISFFQETIRAHRVRLTKIALGCGFVCLMGCSEKNTNIVIADFYINKSVTALHPNEGKWYFQNAPLTGYAVDFYENGQMKERVGYYDGKKQGPATYWYDDGSVAKESYYVENQLNGKMKSWWPDGTLSSESNYSKSQRHGIQKKWHSNGQLASKSNYNQGKDEGLQQAWLENGKIYVNYEIKNGQIFGLKRANLCYTLKDEIVQTK